MSEKKDGLYIFEWFNEEEITYFMVMSETLHFTRGHTIITEGDISDGHAYLIESGSVDVYRHDKKIDSLHTGDIFGEMALVADEPRSATIIANTDVTMRIFNKDEFLMLCKKSGLDDEIKWKILKRMKDNFYDNK